MVPEVTHKKNYFFYTIRRHSFIIHHPFKSLYLDICIMSSTATVTKLTLTCSQVIINPLERIHSMLYSGHVHSCKSELTMQLEWKRLRKTDCKLQQTVRNRQQDSVSMGIYVELD